MYKDLFVESSVLKFKVIFLMILILIFTPLYFDFYHIYIH